MKKSEDTREMLVSGNIVSTMLTLSIPAILGMVVIFMTSAFAKIRKELSETTNPHIENATETASAKVEKMEVNKKNI